MAELNWQWLSLSQACQRLKSGQASALQLTQEMLDRAQALERDTRCYVRLLADDALAAARALDQRQADGEPLGLLHGVPIGIKDLLYTEGLPTASGTMRSDIEGIGPRASRKIGIRPAVSYTIDEAAFVKLAYSQFKKTRKAIA